MCKDCGCGLPGENATGPGAHVHLDANGHPYQHTHEHTGEHDHEHGHDHSHDPEGHHHHDHSHPPQHSHAKVASSDSSEQARRTVQVRRSVLSKNDRLAERNRGLFRAHRLLVLNVLSSPGSGKTTFLRETVKSLSGKLRAAVIVGDLATDNDAQRLRASGAPVVQITTGTMCHLEADMIGRALKQFELDQLQLLIIENVGNLVCPASYDLGEDLRVVLFSVTEGEDKPLKYPPMFQAADVVIVSKVDLAEACDFNREQALASIKLAAPRAKMFELSAKSHQGMAPWLDWLVERHAKQKTGAASVDA
jgi:hydrogenase nickel incorporation protein HypB